MNQLGVITAWMAARLTEAADLLQSWLRAAVAATPSAWAWAASVAAAITNGWNPANTLALLASFVALCLGIYNNVAAQRRERFKNEREEFHRRVATQIEGALSDFDAVLDLVQDLAPSQNLVNAIDAIEKKSQTAQRKLSRSLRRASASQLCQNQGWADLGSQGYDDLITSLDDMRSGGIFDTALATLCSDAIEAIVADVRQRVETELRRFT